MEDFSSDGSSVTDFHSLKSSSIYDDDAETCDSLIDGFEQCNMVEKKILTSQAIRTQKSFKVKVSPSQLVSNNDGSNVNTFEKNSAVESSPESSLNNKHTGTKSTHEVGVNTDRSFNNRVTHFKQPYFKFRKHLNQYHNFKRTYNNYNGISRKQKRTMKNYGSYNNNREFHNRWQFQKPDWQDDRAARGFYFFTQLMKCFNQRF